jgi:hypothetical protein
MQVRPIKAKIGVNPDALPVKTLKIAHQLGQ